MLTLQTPAFAFLCLYFLNLLFDYPLQSTFEAANKSRYNYVLFVHSCIWGLGLSLATVFLVGSIALWKVAMLIIGHMIIDGWKCRTFTAPDDVQNTFGVTMTGETAFYIDQALHVAQLIIVGIVVYA